METIRFRCPRCVGENSAPKTDAGKSVHCRYCGYTLTVPVKSDPDRRDAREDELYTVDAVPRDTREHAAKFDTPEYECPRCGTHVAVFPQEIGHRKFCPDCGTSFNVTQEWFDETRRRHREIQKKSWTDPSRALHPERWTDPSEPPAEIYGVSSSPGSAHQPEPPADETAGTSPEPENFPAAKENLIQVVCGLCGTVMYAEESQIGSQIRCPDCETLTAVTRSARMELSGGTVIEPSQTGGYGLQEEPAPPVITETPAPKAKRLTPEEETMRALAEMEASRKEAPKRTPPPSSRPRVKRRKPKTERSAESELEVETEFIDGQVHYLRSAPPEFPMFNGVFAPLADISIWAISFFVSLLGFGEEVLIRNFLVTSSSGDPGTAAMSSPLVAMILLVALAVISIAGNFFFGIFLPLSDGSKQIGNAFEFDLVSGFGRSIRFLLILFVSLVPGFLAVKFLLPSPGTLASVFLLIFSTLFFFPFVFLATVQYDVPLAPFSPDIVKSLFRCPGAWLGYYFWSFLLTGAPLALLPFIGTGKLSAGVETFLIFLEPPLAAAILGRLAWVISYELDSN